MQMIEADFCDTLAGTNRLIAMNIFSSFQLLGFFPILD